MKTSICLLLTIMTFASVVVAQSHKDKIEIGVQSTSLTLFHPDFQFDDTQVGAGGRVTYNFNRVFAAEAEVNFFPQKQQVLTADGNAIQAQFGVKVGKRFERFGVFAKVRPGFLSVDKVFSLLPGPPREVNGGIGPNFKFERSSFFTLDVGGVLELYPSKRTVVRFEAGDTVIRHPAKYDQVFAVVPTVALNRPPKFNHNFQFTAGVGFRLGDFPDDESKSDSSGGGQQRTPRFEVGVQFTSLNVDPPPTVCQSASQTDARIHNEPGVGGRFTFNLTESIGLEAEGNFYIRDHLLFCVDPAGRVFQGQFGPKIGKRFRRFGLFAKARPGFVGFTKVGELTGTHVQLVGTTPIVVGEFRVVKAYYPSLDVGGVVEFYVSRRWMVRFDVGDTVIRYGELSINAFLPSNPVRVRPPETTHNIQVTSGISFRF